MAKKLLGGALNALNLVGGAARHLAWYLRHQLGSDARDRSDESDRRRDGG